VGGVVGVMVILEIYILTTWKILKALQDKLDSSFKLTEGLYHFGNAKD